MMDNEPQAKTALALHEEPIEASPMSVREMAVAAVRHLGEGFIPGGKGLVPALDVMFGSGQYSQDERTKMLMMSHVVELFPQLVQVLARLEQHIQTTGKDNAPTPSEIAATLEASHRTARRTANKDKRTLLQYALLNAFDPEFYQEGLSLRMLELLETIEYPEVVILRKLLKIEESTESSNARMKKKSELRTEFPLLLYHCDVLKEHRLHSQHSNNQFTTPFARQFLRYISRPSFLDEDES